VKLMRTLRFDASDDHVFERAAGPDEWAVPGAFAFAALDEARLVGKTRQAFANGFLSLESFGWATFVSVAEVAEPEHDRLTDRLAQHLLERYGAPDQAAAMAVAREEIAFALDISADAPVNTVLAVSRRVDDDGQIRETFRAVPAPTGDLHARIWDVVEE
jgi:hypothetical protein